MEVSYHAQVDNFRILLSEKTVFESDEDKPGTMLDYDEVENLSASRF